MGDRDFSDDSEDNLIVAFSGYLQSKFYPKKSRRKTLCLLQTFSICRSDTLNDKYNGMKQLIRTEGQEHFFKCMLFGGTRKQKLREQYKIDMYICIHTHKYKLHIYF